MTAWSSSVSLMSVTLPTLVPATWTRSPLTSWLAFCVRSLTAYDGPPPLTQDDHEGDRQQQRSQRHGPPCHQVPTRIVTGHDFRQA